MPSNQPEVDKPIVFPSSEEIENLDYDNQLEIREDARHSFYNELISYDEYCRIKDATASPSDKQLLAEIAAVDRAIDHLARQNKLLKISFALIILLLVLAHIFM